MTMSRPRAGVAALALLVAVPAAATTDLERGDAAPPLVMEAVDGRRVDTSELDGRTVLLLFGEAAHEKTRLACHEITTALDSPRLDNEPITWILILSKSSRPEDLAPDITGSRTPPIVVHDTERTAFGAYRARVAPTAVVVDGEGRVVHAMAGYTYRFGDIVYDALQLSVGRLSPDRFEQTLHPDRQMSAHDQRHRAERLTRFAHPLSRRGLDDMAKAKYVESIRLVEDYAPARLGLGDLLIRQGRREEAQVQFRAVLAVAPESPEATLGLAHVFVLSGETKLDEATQVTRDLIEHHPTWPRPHYLMGLIHERRGEAAAAAASYRKAAELLLQRVGPDDLVSESTSGS
jgi:hypothetical protein